MGAGYSRPVSRLDFLFRRDFPGSRSRERAEIQQRRPSRHFFRDICDQACSAVQRSRTGAFVAGSAGREHNSTITEGFTYCRMPDELREAIMVSDKIHTQVAIIVGFEALQLPKIEIEYDPHEEIACDDVVELLRRECCHLAPQELSKS